MVNQTKGLPENIKVHMFKNGTDKTLEAEITYRNPETLDEAIEIAEAFQRSYGTKTKTQHSANFSYYGNQNYDSQNYGNRNYSNRSNYINRFDENCQCCGRPGQFTSEHYRKSNDENYSYRNPYNRNTQRFNQRSTNENSNYYPNVTCYNCNQRGHYSPNCPENKHDRNNNNRNDNNRSRRNINDRILNDRNTNDSNKNNINSNNNNNSNNNPRRNEERPQKRRRSNEENKIDVDIVHSVNVHHHLEKFENNSHDLIRLLIEVYDEEIEAVLDTGATHSVMSEDTARRLNLQLNYINEKVKLADGKTTRILGITDELKVKVSHSACKLKFIVLPNKSIPILLGLDWFHKTNAKINFRNQVITFESGCNFTGGYRDEPKEDFDEILMVKDTHDELANDENNTTKLLHVNRDNYTISIDDLKEPYPVAKHEQKLTNYDPIYTPKDNELIDEEVDNPSNNESIDTLPINNELIKKAPEDDISNKDSNPVILNDQNIKPIAMNVTTNIIEKKEFQEKKDTLQEPNNIIMSTTTSIIDQAQCESCNKLFLIDYSIIKEEEFNCEPCKYKIETKHTYKAECNSCKRVFFINNTRNKSKKDNFICTFCQHPKRKTKLLKTNKIFLLIIILLNLLTKVFSLEINEKFKHYNANENPQIIDTRKDCDYITDTFQTQTNKQYALLESHSLLACKDWQYYYQETNTHSCKTHANKNLTTIQHKPKTKKKIQA